MAETLDIKKLAQTLKDLKEAVQNTIAAFERVQDYIGSTLEILEESSTTQPSQPQHVPDSEPEPAPVPSSEPAPEPVVPEVSEPVAEPSSESEAKIPTPPPPPPPPEVSTLQTKESQGHGFPQAARQTQAAPVSTFGPGPTTASPSGATFTVSDSLDKVYQLAQRGGTGLQLHQALLDARDVVQQIVSVHPAFHEIASYSRQLKMLGANPLTENQQRELKEHLDDWKRRLAK
ncbi:MAG: hypothetical protein ACTSW4_05335 [Candidatus Ranarchaeia archaeon]